MKKLKALLLPLVLANLVLISVYLALLYSGEPVAPLTASQAGESIQQPVDQPQAVEIILGGDVMLGRTIMTTSLHRNDPLYPFRGILDYLQSADVVLVNLENPIIQNCPHHTTGFVFCAPPAMLEGLVHANINVVNLANNHTYNYGRAGFEETKKHLDEFGIAFTGAGELLVKNVNGTSFGFLGFDKSQQSMPQLSDSEKALMASARGEVDVFVVSMHWGVEYTAEAIAGVRALARQLVELGADVIHGHHPHWVQNVEYINDKPVYYSLGNLVFDQMWSERTRQGLLVKLTFEDGNLVAEEFAETYMEQWAQPKLVDSRQ